MVLADLGHGLVDGHTQMGMDGGLRRISALR